MGLRNLARKVFPHSRKAFQGTIQGKKKTPNVPDAIEGLLKERATRRGTTMALTLTGAMPGVFAGAAAGKSIHQTVAYALTGSVMESLIAVMSGAGAFRKNVHQATKTVGQSPGIEANRNPKLRTFLKQHPYVYVNHHGQLIGTHRPRMLKIFGRMRLETQKILNHEY
ncbi:MAG: hypothetical protein HY917_04040 [Candidatus Diapherotrites archaeon]|nr:hypothetical protein [Candidatus Diapherotrites archaeon]